MREVFSEWPRIIANGHEPTAFSQHTSILQREVVLANGHDSAAFAQHTSIPHVCVMYTPVTLYRAQTRRPTILNLTVAK